MDSGFCMKVLFVIPAEAGIQAVFYGFPPKLVPASCRRGACGNDGRVTQLTFMFRCDHRVMTVRRNDENGMVANPLTASWHGLV